MSDSNIGGEASILEERRRKLEELRKANIAYVNNVIPSEKAKDLHHSYGHHSKEELEEWKKHIGRAGIVSNGIAIACRQRSNHLEHRLTTIREIYINVIGDRRTGTNALARLGGRIWSWCWDRI